jgi:hypothetical protein
MQFPQEVLNLAARRREAKAVTIAEQGALDSPAEFFKSLPRRRDPL